MLPLLHGPQELGITDELHRQTIMDCLDELCRPTSVSCSRLAACGNCVLANTALHRQGKPGRGGAIVWNVIMSSLQHTFRPLWVGSQ